MHFLKFPISDELNAKIADYIVNVRNLDEKPTKYRLVLASIVEEAIGAAFDYFLVDSLDSVGVNRVSRRGISLALRSAERAIGTANRALVRTLSDDQIRATADFLEESLIKSNPQTP